MSVTTTDAHLLHVCTRFECQLVAYSSSTSVCSCYPTCVTNQPLNSEQAEQLKRCDQTQATFTNQISIIGGALKGLKVDCD